MSTRALLIGLLAMLVLVGGFIGWTVHSSEDVSSKAPLAEKPRPSARASVSRPPKLVVSDRLKALADDGKRDHLRLEIARSIDTDLNEAEIDYLFGILKRDPAHHAREDWWVVMNEIMEQMRKKNVAPARYSQELLSLMNDPGQPEVVRDYCAQHLALWVTPQNGGGHGVAQEECRQVLDALAALIVDPSLAHSSIPGTAMMALTAADKTIAAELIDPAWQKVDPVMSSMLEGKTPAPLALKTTIIQSLALQGSAKHLPLIQQMARDHAIDPSLRLSSIAALGVYAAPEDRAYLTELAESSTKFRYAAQAALKKINQ
ncbi:HEAT repeat domain-containing protein [Rubritalea tangerina]|uniref:HEAT repeat domain-containing protein n=1 Tax=Rubritalea tangerina TaxID=430798 RepID=A0ABW4ZCL7_9BACT